MENEKRTDAMRVRPGMSSILVSAGSYVISGKKRTVLAAILGTCVGVTLCDRLANCKPSVWVVSIIPVENQP